MPGLEVAAAGRIAAFLSQMNRSHLRIIASLYHAVIWLACLAAMRQNPEIGDQKTLKIMDLLLQLRKHLHIRMGINIIDAIEAIQGDSVSEKMVAFESRGNANICRTRSLLSSRDACALHVMQKDCHNRYRPAQEVGQKIFIKEDLVDTIFARSFH
jgi:hypothetical protein